MQCLAPLFFFFFFFNDTATTEIYPLSLHDALPISLVATGRDTEALLVYQRTRETLADTLGVDPSPELSALHVALLRGDRKSTRLNSSHLGISYAVFCLKKKKTLQETALRRQDTDER